MGGVLVILALIALGWIVATLKDSFQKDAVKTELARYSELVRKGLKVVLTDDTFQPSDGSKALPVKRLALTGAIQVPTDQHPVRFRVRLLDVTDSTSDPAPLICVIDTLSDANGCFEFSQEANIPYRFSEVNNMAILGIPLFAIVGPRRGQRTIKVLVAITARESFQPVYAYGETHFEYRQEQLGYTDKYERTKSHERRIATLAIAFAAADGNLDDAERRVIKNFFADHLDGNHESEQRQREIKNAIDQAVQNMRSNTESVSQLIRRLCIEIRADGDEVIPQVAYELCVKVVAADSVVNQHEQKALAYVARELGLPIQFVQETNDRILRIRMYHDDSDEKLLGMPDNLSPVQQREFLNKEYSKWKARVTHRDPKVVAEASMRLDVVTRMRSKIND